MREVLRPPKALVLAAPGINRDKATQTAFRAAGAEADIVNINQLKRGEVSLGEYQIFSLSGGFSFGDHIQSGRILALEIQRNNLLADQILAHLEKGRLILGVCNGFQVLVQAGLLPFGQIHALNENVATLWHNEPRQFQSRWIFLQPQESRCLFVNDSDPITLPIAHGEGRFLSNVTNQLFADGQVVYQYCDQTGEIVDQYPVNPNGSARNIAAICDPSGQILGMMPHAEDFIRKQHYPNWRRGIREAEGLRFFQQLVKVAREI